MRENLSSGFVKNKGADQPVHQRLCYSLFGKYRISATGEISIFRLVSVAEETGLSLALFWSLAFTSRPILH